MDLQSIQSSISTQLAQWQSILSFVNEKIDNKIDSNLLSIWWRKNTTNVDYNAWYINNMALPVMRDDFYDPLTNKPYVIWITTRNNWKYEIVASMEQYKWSPYAYLSWTYIPRVSTEISCAKNSTINNTINIDSNNKDAFYPWDYVVVKTNSWEINEVINLVSSDWLTITLSGEVNNPSSIRLRESESIWLIDRKDADWSSGNNFVTNSGSNLPY